MPENERHYRHFTFDERCTDGVNLAKTIKLLTDCIENPEQLMTPPKDMPDPLEFA